MSGFRWSAARVLRALGRVADLADEEVVYARVWTDTRTVGPGDLFVALQGQRFDAHEFLGQAAEAGATGAVVARVPEGAPEGLDYYVVEDTLTALAQLARFRRRALHGRVVCITGTNGKTTTKDIVRAALGASFRVHATEGNLNNQIGVPITLLAAPDEAEAVVVEIGMNEPGEIAILTAIAEPEAGIVTSVGAGHLEKVGSVEGVLVEKTSLLAALPPGGLAFVAEDPESLPARARKLVDPDCLWVAGLSEGAQLAPDGGLEGIEVLPDGTTRWRWEGTELHLPLRGRHNVRNALLALGLAREWGVSPEDAARAIEAMPAPKLRGEWQQVGGVRLIADCYNANPSSLSAAVDLLANLPSEGAKVAVVGTMRELGAQADELHRRAAEEIAGRVGEGIDRVVATGAFVEAFEPLRERLGERIVAHPDPVEAYPLLRPALQGNETILLKGSRGEALERWIPLLERDWSGTEPS